MGQTALTIKQNRGYYNNNPTMAKSKQRLLARKYRKEGLGIKTIAGKLQVSPSTVSLWCRDIHLSTAQIKELEVRAHDPYYGKRLAYVQKQQKIRLEKVVHLFREGQEEVGQLTKQQLFASGIALYWAEGFKKDNMVGFSNSDPTMILFFVRWLESCCSISKDRLKLRVGVNESYRKKVKTIEGYWSRSLNIPKNQFQKPFFQKVLWKKIYENADDYHGVLRVRVSKSTDLLRKIHGWIEGFRKNSSARGH